MGPRRTAEETGKQDQLWHTAAKMDERTMTSYEVQKAIESERDNKFARRRTPPDRARQRHLMPEVLQVEDESRPATTSSGPAPSSGNPTPMDRPFAGMRELGQLPMGANKMLKTGPLSRRVSITENIQKLGESPTSPSSPASPTTMRSPLRFFRAREDKRDQNFVAAATSSEAKPAVVLRERVRSEAIEKMDRKWEIQQKRNVLRSLQRIFEAVIRFLRTKIFGGWGKWFQETFVTADEQIEQYMEEVKKTPLHSLPRLRALESILNLSYLIGNVMTMIQNEMLPFMINETKQAHDGSAHQAVALAAIRNLCHFSGYRVAASKEVTEVLVAVCWAVEDHLCKQHALGALANLAANERPGEIILDQEALEVVLYLTNYGSEFAKLLTDMEREVRCLALMVLFNLSVVHKNRHRLLRHKVLEKLQTVLQEPALVGLLATITSMHLITHKSHPMLIFSERQDNIPELVRCFRHAVEEERYYGLKWNARHLAHAIGTVMKYEPNQRQLVKAGLDDVLVKVVFGHHESIREKIFMSTARELRKTLAPLVSKLDSARGHRQLSAEQLQDREHERRAGLINKNFKPRPSLSRHSYLEYEIR